MNEPRRRYLNTDLGCPRHAVSATIGPTLGRLGHIRDLRLRLTCLYEAATVFLPRATGASPVRCRRGFSMPQGVPPTALVCRVAELIKTPPAVWPRSPD